MNIIFLGIKFWWLILTPICTSIDPRISDFAKNMVVKYQVNLFKFIIVWIEHTDRNKRIFFLKSILIKFLHMLSNHQYEHR